MTVRFHNLDAVELLAPAPALDASRSISASLWEGPRKIDWTSVALGERPDAEIAAELGIPTSHVARARLTATRKRR